MNGHGRDAQAYWQRWLPERYAEIDDVDAFFSDLGDRVAERVEAAWDQLMIKDDPPAGERRAEREARIADLKRKAEIAVTQAMVFLPPEVPPADRPSTGESANRDDWRVQTCAALIEGRLTLDQLSDQDLTALIAYAGPHFLLAVGTSVDEQRALGRPV